MKAKEILYLREGDKIVWEGNEPDKHIVETVFHGYPNEPEDMNFRVTSETYGSMLLEGSELLNKHYKLIE